MPPVIRLLALFFLSALNSVWAERMEPAEEPEEVGLVSIGASYFPTPEGVAQIELTNPGFEADLKTNSGWTLLGWDWKTGEAPQGEHYLQSLAGKKLRLGLSGLPAQGWTPYLISFWLRSNAEAAGRYRAQGVVRFGAHTPLQVPNTGGEWRRVGFYVRTTVGAQEAEISISFPDDAEIAIDDVRIREASEAEFSKAFAGWRNQYPERDLNPRPEDGRNLALFLRKLQAPQEPTRPLLVMGIGSSYTNMLGNGERLVQHIRERFPDAPPIHYWKHVGSAVEFDYTQGWMQQLVVGEQPDLVILYSGGNAEDLDTLLTDFRARSTADIIVASLHLRKRDEVISPETIDNEQWDTIREVAAKHGVEFVESRREWAAYLQNLGEDIPYLLKDAVHQSDHGALVINENIVRHITPNDSPAYKPDERERRILAINPKSIREGESLSFSEDWTRDGDCLVAREKGATLTLRFKGNRVDLIGEATPPGGSARVEIDGIPSTSFPAFHTTLIVPGNQNHRPERGLTADRAPHAIRLKENIVPQDWTLRMISDSGDYELIGSVTGPDGKGNNGEDFVSDSGQIEVPAHLWRRRQESDGSYSNRTGDTFHWSVRRATQSADLHPGDGEKRLVRRSLVQNAENDWHTLTLITESAHEYRVRAFDVFEPPLP